MNGVSSTAGVHVKIVEEYSEDFHWNGYKVYHIIPIVAKQEKMAWSKASFFMN